jgi:hypothetical protein
MGSGCREKPFEKTRSTLAEVHLSAAVHDAHVTDGQRVTDEMAVFGTDPLQAIQRARQGFPRQPPTRAEATRQPITCPSTPSFRLCASESGLRGGARFRGGAGPGGGVCGRSGLDLVGGPSCLKDPKCPPSQRPSHRRDNAWHEANREPAVTDRLSFGPAGCLGW